MIALARNLGAGIGISVFTAFVARRDQFHQLRLSASMRQEPWLLPGIVAGLRQELVQRGAGRATAAHKALLVIYQQLLRHASALSYLDGFRVMAILLVIAVPFVWIMRKPQFKSGEA